MEVASVCLVCSQDMVDPDAHAFANPGLGKACASRWVSVIYKIHKRTKHRLSLTTRRHHS
eukprot:scaffold35402_cov49-Attheya_sp.AAC.2